MNDKQTPRVIECANLVGRDFYGTPDSVVIVKTARASNFRVECVRPGFFIVYGRTEFVGGSTTVKGIEALRRLLVTR